MDEGAKAMNKLITDDGETAWGFAAVLMLLGMAIGSGIFVMNDLNKRTECFVKYRADCEKVYLPKGNYHE